MRIPSASVMLAMGLLVTPSLGHSRQSPYGGVDHTKKIDAYAGPETCMDCHKLSKMGSNLAEDVFNSAHFQLRAQADFVDMPGGGSHGMLDRACGLPGTSAMANNYAGTTSTPGGYLLEDGCGKCHVAYRPPHKYASAEMAIPEIDCLICHAAVYGAEWDDPDNIAQYGDNPEPHAREVFVLDGANSWSQDRSLKTAESVGNLPQAESCLRCHEHGFSGYKRAAPFHASTDVHAAANVDCRDCHTMERHKIARGNYVSDGVANDMPEVGVDCALSCHGGSPHSALNAEVLNRHITNVACESCHIPEMAGEGNIARRAWAPFTMDPTKPPSDAWDPTPAMTDAEYPGFWDANTTYHPEGSTPTIRWFDGTASMLAQPFGDHADRRSAGGNSRLFAFKPFVNGMLFDAAWFPGPASDPDFDLIGDTWPYSMKWFYEQNWDAFYAFGFVDYATAAAYWGDRPDMAVMLNYFPMMLQFDRIVYLSEAGEVLGTPVPGPQSAATYPGIARAVNMGMGRMGIDMGYFPPDSDPEMMGQFLWSGAFFGMWVPMNMDPISSFYGEIVSFITMSHSIKGGADMGDPCYSCHFTVDEYAGNAVPGSKRLDFAMLGYTDGDGNGLVDPRYENVQQEIVCSDGVDNDGDGSVDCADSDCSGIQPCGRERKGPTCSDGYDNDGDGLTDCDDPDCSKDPTCR